MRRVERRNKLKKVRAARFLPGDFVLVRRAQPGEHKLRFIWQGPRRITQVRSEWLYEVQNLITAKCGLVYARRSHLYRPSIDEKDVLPSLLKAAEHSESNY